jgi:hypothetical protein
LVCLQTNLESTGWLVLTSKLKLDNEPKQKHIAN